VRVRRVAIRIAVREVQRAAARAAKERRELVVSYDDLPDPGSAGTRSCSSAGVEVWVVEVSAGTVRGPPISPTG